MSSQPRSSHRLLATLALMLALAVPGIVAADNAPGDSALLSAIDIDNFARVNATYYRGAEPEEGDYADLAALGIKTVIDLRSDDVDPQAQRWAEGAGLQYVAIPMTTHRPPTDDEIALFLRTVNGAGQQPVYVHCVGGRHRTGVMTAVYRMTQDRWDPDRAFKEMKQYKYGADFLHPEFKRFVYAYRPEVALATN